MWNEQELDQKMIAWMNTKRFIADATINAKILQRVHENLVRLGGYPSVASFERSYLELLDEGAIKQFRGTAADQPAPAIPQAVIDWIENPRTSVQELRLQYRNDKEFRRLYDLYEANKKGQAPEQQPGVVSLSVEEYRKLPAAEVAGRYRVDRGFKMAVDKLIAEGRI